MRIVFERADGSIGIVIPAPNTGLTIEQVAAQAVPPGAAYKIVAKEDLPTDRTYRNAWAIDPSTGGVHHEMTKAREIHRNRMRGARTPLMADLDTQYLRADELGAAVNATKAAKAAISVQKRILRDVTAAPEIAAASTIEQLKAVWPAILGPRTF